MWRFSPSELFDGSDEMKFRPEGYKMLIENPFVLGKMPVPLFYGAEGTLYIEFCSDCYIVSMQHQQT